MRLEPFVGGFCKYKGVSRGLERQNLCDEVKRPTLEDAVNPSGGLGFSYG